MSILKTLPDPTYVPDRINADPEWKIAFVLSELVNDDAPIGWSAFIPIAKKAIEDARLSVRDAAKMLGED